MRPKCNGEGGVGGRWWWLMTIYIYTLVYLPSLYYEYIAYNVYVISNTTLVLSTQLHWCTACTRLVRHTSICESYIACWEPIYFPFSVFICIENWFWFVIYTSMWEYVCILNVCVCCVLFFCFLLCVCVCVCSPLRILLSCRNAVLFSPNQILKPNTCNSWFDGGIRFPVTKSLRQIFRIYTASHMCHSVLSGYGILLYSYTLYLGIYSRNIPYIIYTIYLSIQIISRHGRQKICTSGMLWCLYKGSKNNIIPNVFIELVEWIHSLYSSINLILLIDYFYLFDVYVMCFLSFSHGFSFLYTLGWGQPMFSGRISIEIMDLSKNAFAYWLPIVYCIKRV